jgi:hypothetical protein
MIRQVLVVVALLSVGVPGASGAPAQARNEDVPKGPGSVVPVPGSSDKKGSPSESPTGSAGSGKSAPSGDSKGGKDKPAAPGK